MSRCSSHTTPVPLGLVEIVVGRLQFRHPVPWLGPVSAPNFPAVGVLTSAFAAAPMSGTPLLPYSHVTLEVWYCSMYTCPVHTCDSCSELLLVKSKLSGHELPSRMKAVMAVGCVAGGCLERWM